MLKRNEIQVLRQAGYTLTEVAQSSGASVRTVRRVVEETAVTAIDNAADRARRQVGSPSTAEAFGGRPARSSPHPRRGSRTDRL